MNKYFIKNQIKKIFQFFGFKISKGFNLIPLFKRNIFNSQYSKRVLISYMIEPFVKKNDFSHSNLLECYTAAEIFNELGFCVDVIDLSSNKKIDYSKYDVIYGMGSPLERSFYFDKKKIKRIFYATGCNPIFSNINTLNRIRNFYNYNKKFLLSSTRYISTSFNLQLLLSDYVIVLGNDFVLDTYNKFDENGKDRYINLNAFYYDVYDIDISKKDFSESKKHFLWFGSSGLIHKGLDSLIDLFSERDDIFLHICGAPQTEKEFFDHYNQKLIKSSNIINHGFVDIKSDKFKKIMDKCAFTIFPSVSEGGAVSILNTVANGGLIPIITKSTGLNVEDFGIFIEKPDLNLVKDSIEKALSLDLNNLRRMSILAKKDIRDNYTYNKYRQNLKNLIKKII